MKTETYTKAIEKLFAATPAGSQPIGITPTASFTLCSAADELDSLIAQQHDDLRYLARRFNDATTDQRVFGVSRSVRDVPTIGSASTIQNVNDRAMRIDEKVASLRTMVRLVLGVPAAKEFVRLLEALEGGA